MWIFSPKYQVSNVLGLKCYMIIVSYLERDTFTSYQKSPWGNFAFHSNLGIKQNVVKKLSSYLLPQKFYQLLTLNLFGIMNT